MRIELKTIEDYIKGILVEQNYSEWIQELSISYNGRFTRTLGQVTYRKGAFPYKIEFSKKSFDTMTEKDQWDVIKHEMAHVLASISTGERHAHDEIFRQWCKKLGTTNYGEVFGKEKQIKYKYKLVCPHCGEVIRFYKRRSPKFKEYEDYYSCYACGGIGLEVITL